MKIEFVVLAAGQGTRMRSKLPKVLHEIGGLALLEHVLRTVETLSPSCIHVVVGAGHDMVRERLGAQRVNWVLQEEQKGTGHAAALALSHLDSDSIVIVLYGDVPMVQASTLAALVKAASTGGLALITAEVKDPSGLGRIVRDGEGRMEAIVEERDACQEQLAIHEINSGIMALGARLLGRWISRLEPDNAQGEYYLTDLVRFAVGDGVEVYTVCPEFEEEVWGVNNPEELARVERAYQRRVAQS